MNPWQTISQTAPRLTALLCSNCGATLNLADFIIVERNVVECEYCESKFLVQGLEQVIEEPDPDYWDDSPYFFKGGVESRSFDYFWRGEHD
jgi:DNA-directed RNA polymerase subunit RPC12/RpoP